MGLFHLDLVRTFHTHSSADHRSDLEPEPGRTEVRPVPRSILARRHTERHAWGVDQSKALLLDVDGVVSPVHGRTSWGDDVVAGHSFGPVATSPEMCERIDSLAKDPDLLCLWLTSWTEEMRKMLKPFPGSYWDDLPAPGEIQPGEDEWWKWDALQAWLCAHPSVKTVVWCDDDLQRTHFAGSLISDPDSIVDRRPVYREWFDERGIDSLLIAPATVVGLTREHLGQIKQFLSFPR